MTTRTGWALTVTAVLAVGVSIGVARTTRGGATKPPPAASATAGEPQRTFTDAAAGIAVSYPAAWHPAPAKTAELNVAAPAAHASLALDVPAMSFHPPFIPIGVVASKYVEALRQGAIPDAAVRETTDLKVAGATARRVSARGHAAAGGGVLTDTAVLIVHKGQIFILSCDSDDDAAATARATLDAAVASVRWTK